MDVYGCLWMFMMDISIVGFINQLRIFGSPWGPHLVLLYLWGLLSLLPEWWQYLSKKTTTRNDGNREPRVLDFFGHAEVVTPLGLCLALTFKSTKIHLSR